METQESQRFQPLSPRGLAVAFAVLALLGSLTMATPLMFGMGSMMGGPYGTSYYPHMGWVGGFGWFGLIWFIAVAALGGAVVAWVYNAMIGARPEQSPDRPGRPLPPTPTHP